MRLRIDAECTSAAVLQACLLITRVPLLYVDGSDVMIALEDLDKLSMGGSQNTCSQSASQSQPKIANIRGKPNANSSIIISPNGKTRRPNILPIQNQVMLPEFAIRSQQLVRREVNDYRAWMAVADSTRELYPSSLRAKHRSCPRGTILHNLDWLQEQLAIVTFTWERFTSVKLLECKLLDQLGRRHIDDKAERFVILPIRRDRSEVLCGLMIFDKQRQEWGWIHPDNNAKISSDLLAEVKELLAKCGLRYANWEGKIIIISSSYHKEFAYVHLIMALYYTAKLFAYAVLLPSKVVYTEQSFRLYAYYHCLAVQIANQERNLMMDLLDEQGEPKERAFISLC